MYDFGLRLGYGYSGTGERLIDYAELMVKDLSLQALK